MVATEPNIKNLSKSFLAYSTPSEGTRSMDSLITQDLVQQLTIKLNELSEMLQGKEKRMEKMITILEQITWVTNPDKEAMKLIEGIVKDTINYLRLEKKFIADVKPLAAKGYVKKEFSIFLAVYEDLEEALMDIKSTFYSLPADKDFYAALKDLESL